MLRTKLIYAVLLVLGMSSGLRADEIRYFQGNINYWDKPQKESDASLPRKKEEPIEQKQITPRSFEWQTYLDPQNREFFREGDYIPPEPFMELVRNPTDQNISMWFAYMKKKNELADRLAQRMEDYTERNRLTISQEAKAKIIQTANRLPVPEDDFERFRFRMYFDSQCPHCQHMFETLNDLQDRGYFVEARQIDHGPLNGIKSRVVIVQADKEEATKYKIEAVPLLLIGDLKNKKIYRQSGYVTPEQIIAQIRNR